MKTWLAIGASLVVCHFRTSVLAVERFSLRDVAMRNKEPQEAVSAPSQTLASFSLRAQFSNQTIEPRDYYAAPADYKGQLIEMANSSSASGSDETTEEMSSSSCGSDGSSEYGDQYETAPAWSPHIQHAIRDGHVQSRGVNLGGWLVTEGWMARNSEIYRGLDDRLVGGGEQQVFTHTSPRDVAENRFRSHRESFITEHDIAKIAAAGLNTVRVPVGYWITGFDNHDISDQKQWMRFASGGLAFLDRLIFDWAKKHNVAVLISMHGGKGSQNGADHSAPEQPGKTLWAQYPENVASTLEAVTFLAARYQREDAFLGIGLLNEPSGDTDRRVLYKYYEDAYKAIREDAGNDCILTIAPLLWEQSPRYMTDLLPGATNVWVEWHRYFVWGYEQATSDDLLGSAIDQFRHDVDEWKRKSDKKVYIGEFSFASVGKFNSAMALTEFGRRQMSVLLESVDGGWAFWSWCISQDEHYVNAWSMRSLIQRGIFPALAREHGTSEPMVVPRPTQAINGGSSTTTTTGSSTTTNTGSVSTTTNPGASPTSSTDTSPTTTTGTSTTTTGSSTTTSSGTSTTTNTGSSTTTDPDIVSTTTTTGTASTTTNTGIASTTTTPSSETNDTGTAQTTGTAVSDAMKTGLNVAAMSVLVVALSTLLATVSLLG